MEIAVILHGIVQNSRRDDPWILYCQPLAQHGIHLRWFEGDEIPRAFERPFDAMMLHVWLDYRNDRRFDPRQTMKILERYSAYRARYPETVQIILNHTDMARRPFVLPYWRPGDPVLYRTPAYDRSELDPLPADSIWPYEKVWGSDCLRSTEPPQFRAAFIGRESGPTGYRRKVAEQTAKVGIGMVGADTPLEPGPYRELLARSQIAVCPRGWGEQSLRHWDAWRSEKPVLTDRDCAAVEMIPGQRLEAGVHYLVYDEPEQIPEIVLEWTAPDRAADLARIAKNGRQAALSYDGMANFVAFLDQAVAGP